LNPNGILDARTVRGPWLPATPGRPPSVADAVRLFSLLSDPSRLRIVMYLARHGEQTVSVLRAACGQSQPSTSHHLMLLRLGGVVTYRRDGKCHYYSLQSALVRRVLAQLAG
jgi:DNA-binding transcriptional ArsR family regulator